jgi:COP9 signalosome complex subunit 1
VHPEISRGVDVSCQGRTAVDRLIHIIAACPSVALQAFHLAVEHIHQLRDPSLYHAALSAYESVQVATGDTLPPPSDVAPLDPKWIEEVIAKNQAERTKLDVELKTYSNNMIKESIRVRCSCPFDAE